MPLKNTGQVGSQGASGSDGDKVHTDSNTDNTQAKTVDTHREKTIMLVHVFSQTTEGVLMKTHIFTFL